MEKSNFSFDLPLDTNEDSCNNNELAIKVGKKIIQLSILHIFKKKIINIYPQKKKKIIY